MGRAPRPGRQSKTWHKCLVDIFTGFRATEGSIKHSPLVFGVETALWQVAATKTGRWVLGVLEVAERFTVRWHENEAKLSRQRHASVVRGVQGNGQGGGDSRRETAADKSRKEMAAATRPTSRYSRTCIC